MEGTTPQGVGAGAPSAPTTTTPADPSPATTSQESASEHDLMLASLSRRRQGQGAERSAQKSPTRPADDRPAAGAAAQEPAVRPDGSEDGKSAPAESEKQQKKQPESIPYAAFKERLAREAEKQKGLETSLSTAQRELAEYQKGFALLEAELARERGLRQQGVAWDDREAQIRSYELADQARAAREEIEQQVREQAATQAQEQRRAALREQLREEFSEAHAKYPHLHAEEIREAWEANPHASAAAIAEELHRKKLEAIQPFLPKPPPPPPPAPATARAGPAGAAPVFTDDDDGMLQWLRAKRG
jgi:hypothetical protein